MEYRDAIRSKETRQRRPGERDAVVQWIMAVYFELTSLARVKFLHTNPIRESVDSLYRDDTGEISRDPRTKRLKTR